MFLRELHVENVRAIGRASVGRGASTAGVPAPLAALVETCVRLAREGPRRALLSNPK